MIFFSSLWLFLLSTVANLILRPFLTSIHLWNVKPKMSFLINHTLHILWRDFFCIISIKIFTDLRIGKGNWIFDLRYQIWFFCNYFFADFVFITFFASSKLLMSQNNEKVTMDFLIKTFEKCFFNKHSILKRL